MNSVDHIRAKGDWIAVTTIERYLLVSVKRIILLQKEYIGCVFSNQKEYQNFFYRGIML